MNQREGEQLLPGEENHDQMMKEMAVPGAPDKKDIAAAPPDHVQEHRLEGAGQRQGVEPVGGAKVELVDNPLNVAEEERKEFGVVDEKVVRDFGIGKREGEGVVGGNPVGVAEEVKQEVAVKREVRGEGEEETGERAAMDEGNLEGGEDKVTGRELKALKAHS